MNHNYPTNGLPFSQSVQHHAGASYPPQPSPVPTGPNMSGQYIYSLPHSPYPPHAYPTYPPYAPPLMMYGPPHSNAPPPAPSPVPSAIPATGKRKRQTTSESPRETGVGDKDSDQEAGGSGNAQASHQASQPARAVSLADTKKRTKTQRACDSCRSRKIRFVSAPCFPVRCSTSMRINFRVGYLCCAGIEVVNCW